MNFKTLSVIFTIFIWISTAGIANAASNPKWIFYDGFETGKISSLWNTNELCCSHASQVVTTPTASGRYAHKTTLNRTDPNPIPNYTGRRAELWIRNTNTGRNGVERWYGESIFIPSDWTDDYPINRDYVAQWKNGPGSPALAFRIEEGEFQIENRWDQGGGSTANSRIGEQAEIVWRGPLAAMKGKWVDWIVHAKWSHKSDGLLEIWKDGQQIVKKQGPNARNITDQFTFKIGVYKWSWDAENYPGRPTRVSKRVVYHDEVRIAGADATLGDLLLNQPLLVKKPAPPAALRIGG